MIPKSSLFSELEYKHFNNENLKCSYLVKLGNVDDAIETFNNGLELAVALEDISAQAAISKALADLQRRSSGTSHFAQKFSLRKFWSI